MNYVKLSGAVVALSVSSFAGAQDYQFIAADNNPMTKLCVSIANNDLSATKARLYNMGLGAAIRQNINRITCNDMSTAQFAHKFKASDTFVYLNNRSSYANKEKPSVTISDIAKVESSQQPVVVYVSAAPK
ncbi:DUF3718 domain-containing protein [Alteromonas lipolytica]|uniref:DUF3718 domain-containing protein n=1 Tax=Alteromonas lipolytica TaxID=1856405 RepID=A0A1E8FKA5_9ALTE|nr:DUF3718 domain-containing protein [Alteromonas lipolytica]OFI36186.1 hypothetical protein BFC17_08655 [Alteromonas lipolytica]GGF78497.1 hypothetical protein GCM10011338_33630 [Alteromonas lipolytica]